MLSLFFLGLTPEKKMGSSFKKAVFEEHIQEGLVGWAQKARRKAAANGFSSQVGHKESPSVEMKKVLLQSDSSTKTEKDKADGEIEPAT